ncbi:MAG: hypothetical protein NT031_04285, partial [Planctomycetota bacterium]|nr:hypothetical protein [Planctomycetota bacterium]
MRTTRLCALAAALLLPLTAMGQPMGGRGWGGGPDRPGPMGPDARQAPARAGQDCPFCRMRQADPQWRQEARTPRGPWMAHGFGRRGQEMMPQQPGRHGRGGEGIGPMQGRFGMRRHGQGMAQGPCGSDPQARPGETLRQMWQQHAQHTGAGAPGVGGRAHGMQPPSLAPENAARPHRPQAAQAATRGQGTPRDSPGRNGPAQGRRPDEGPCRRTPSPARRPPGHAGARHEGSGHARPRLDGPGPPHPDPPGSRFGSGLTEIRCTWKAVRTRRACLDGCGCFQGRATTALKTGQAGGTGPLWAC